MTLRGVRGYSFGRASLRRSYKARDEGDEIDEYTTIFEHLLTKAGRGALKYSNKA